MQTIGLVGLNEDAEERSFRWVIGKCTKRDRAGGIEAVILDNDSGLGFAGVIAASGNGPYLTAFHHESSSETASMKLWSSIA